MGFPFSFQYDTLSGKKRNKFRVVFQNDTAVAENENICWQQTIKNTIPSIINKDSVRKIKIIVAAGSSTPDMVRVPCPGRFKTNTGNKYTNDECVNTKEVFNVRLTDPMLYDRLNTLSAEYSVSVELLVNAAVKRLVDDVDFVRGLRNGRISSE